MSTSKLRDFWVGLPAACGLPPGWAEIEGKRNGELFDWEVLNHDSVLRRVSGQTSRQRLARAFSGWEDLADTHVVEYAKRLAELVDRASHANSVGKDDIIVQAEAATLRVLEPGFPTVSALMTVDEAVVQGNWS